MQNIKDKVVVIAGASSGIGMETGKVLPNWRGPATGRKASGSAAASARLMLWNGSTAWISNIYAALL